MQSLTTKLVKFYLSRKVASHNIFHFLTNGRLESVTVDTIAVINVFVVNFCGAPKKSGNVFFEYGKRGVEIFEDSYDGVLCFDGTFCTLKGTISVERAVKIS